MGKRFDPAGRIGIETERERVAELLALIDGYLATKKASSGLKAIFGEEGFEKFKSSGITTLGPFMCANLVFWHSALQDAKLSPYARAVYTDLAMRDNGKNGGNHAFAGIRKIAQSCGGLSTKTVVRSIKELEAAGLIEVKRQSRKRSHYRVRSLEEWQQWKVKTVFPRNTDSLLGDPKLYSYGTQPVFPRNTDLCSHVKRKEIKKRSKKEIYSADAQKTLFSQTDSAKPAKRKFDQIPSLSELIDYCLKLGLAEKDARWLDDHWRAYGFGVRGRQIKDWHALVRNWKRRDYFPSQKQRGSSHKGQSPL